jgi:hypothetical protein
MINLVKCRKINNNNNKARYFEELIIVILYNLLISLFNYLFNYSCIKNVCFSCNSNILLEYLFIYSFIKKHLQYDIIIFKKRQPFY